MNRLKLILGVVILAVASISCEQDDLTESTFDTTTTADVVLGRGSGTKPSATRASSRPELQMVVPTTGIGGTVTQNLDSNLAHNVQSIDVVIEETDGAIATQSLITLEKIADNGIHARFKATGVDFENGYVPNLALNAQLTFKNEAGEAINNEPFDAYPTAQSRNGIYLRNPKINCEVDGTCIFTIKVKGNNAAQVATLQGTVSNEAGDVQDVIFTRAEGGGEEMNHVAAENPVFQSPGGSSNNVLNSITPYDTNGVALDSQIELVAFPEIDYGPQVGKLEITRFGNSTFYMAETAIRGTNRELATEVAITVMQDFSESEFYNMPIVASSENRDLYWKTFDGLDFNLVSDLGSTMFGLALDEEENVLDIKKKEITVQQAAIMPDFVSAFTEMNNGNLKYSITFSESQNADLVTWVVFEDGSRTEKGRYKLKQELANPLVWTAKNISPATENGLVSGETISATIHRVNTVENTIIDGAIDQNIDVPSTGIDYEFSETVIARISGGGIRIKGTVFPMPTGGAPINNNPSTNRIVIPQGNMDGTNLTVTLGLEPAGDNPDVYQFNTIINGVNTAILGSEFEAEVTVLDIDNEVLVVKNVLFTVIDEESAIAIQLQELTQNEDGETFTLTTTIDGVGVNAVAEVAVFMTPQDGGSDVDPEDFTLNFVSQNGNLRTYTNEFVTFSDPDSVIDMEYLVEYTFTDAAGIELAYLEEMLVGLE